MLSSFCCFIFVVFYYFVDSQIASQIASRRLCLVFLLFSKLASPETRSEVHQLSLSEAHVLFYHFFLKISSRLVLLLFSKLASISHLFIYLIN